MNPNIPLVNIPNDAATQDHIDTKTSAKPISKPLYVSPEKIYVRSIAGFFQKIRSYSLSILLLMYFAFCWIEVGGEPLILFDIDARKFHLFGTTFWTQDFTLLAFALIICAFGLFFITSLFGRVWCGYSCPQTVWSFMFIWLEEFFEGSRHQRIKLDKSTTSLRKILKKSAKHLSWLLLSLATAITFVAYFYPIRELLSDMYSLSLNSDWAIFWIIFFTAATYINAGWLREQVCIYMCPYARFQSVMFNENTLIVGYDKKRGEPRGSRSRHRHQEQEQEQEQEQKQKQKQKENLGDCVECQMCVQVCPTGIDIRDGLQYECIGCALCIDACDSIMKKMSYSTGLIRYASEKEFETGTRQRKLDNKTISYGLILAASMVVFGFILATRPLIELSVLRDRGALYQENGMGQIENAYTLKVANKTEEVRTYFLEIDEINAQLINKEAFIVGPGELRTFPITVAMDPKNINHASTSIHFTLLLDNGSAQKVATEKVATEKVTAESKFLGPVNSW